MPAQLPLIISDQEPRVDSRIIAGQLGVEHESFRKLIYQYQADFEEFGILRFEIGEIKGRGQPEKYALLNEDQSYLGLTYAQNTPQARELKKRLVHTFGAYRTALRQGITAELQAAITQAVRATLTTTHRPDGPSADATALDALIDKFSAPPRSATPTVPDWKRIVGAILNEIDQKWYSYPYRFKVVDGQRGLIIRTNHIMEYLAQTPHLSELWQQLTTHSGRVLKRQLRTAGVLLRSRYDAYIGRQRLVHAIVINLAPLRSKAQRTLAGV